MEVKEMNIYQRMSAITNELGRVTKNLNVGVGQSAYKAVGEADILDTVKPIEEKYGVYSYPFQRKVIDNGVLESEGIDFKTKQPVIKKQMYLRIETVYRFVNIDNPTEFIDITTYGDGIDSQDKAPGKGMTYGDKYALMKAYKISTGDDPDQNASEPLKGMTKNQDKPSHAEQHKAEQVAASPIDDNKLQSLQAELDRTGYSAMSICKGYKVNSLKELNVKQYADAMTKLKGVKDKPKTDLGLE